MSDKTDQLVAELVTAVQSDAFLEACYRVCDALAEEADGQDAIASILALMEGNEEIDFGMPGPLVHFVERFYRNGYEELLWASIRRQATPHTLWMLNRLVNGATEEEASLLIDLMFQAAEARNTSPEARQVALEFLDAQGYDVQP